MSKRLLIALVAILLPTLAFAQGQVVNTELPAAAAASDTDANTASPSIRTFGMYWTGSAWARDLFGVAGTPAGPVRTIQGASGMTAVQVAGAKTNNNAAPGANNIGGLTMIANAAIPAWTEGNMVAGSVDLHGATRMTIQDSAGVALQLASDYVHDAALTVATSSGPALICRSSTSAPAGTSADDDASLVSCDRTGAIRVTGSSGTTQYTEDAAATDGASLVAVGFIRRDTAPTSSAGAAGENSQGTTDAFGRIYVNAAPYDAAGAALAVLANPYHVQPGYGGVAAVAGNGVSGTGVQRVTIASDSTGQVALAAGTAFVGQAAGVATATVTNTTAPCYITSAASTNATNCKASAGNLYSIQAINTTATLYFLRLYNLASAPTCSSATGFVRTVPLPASATGAGVVIPQDVGEGFATGIGFCLTGGGASTDNTSAATGVYLTLLYK